jgi:hypothetical protein
VIASVWPPGRRRVCGTSRSADRFAPAPPSVHETPPPHACAGGQGRRSRERRTLAQRLDRAQPISPIRAPGTRDRLGVSGPFPRLRLAPRHRKTRNWPPGANSRNSTQHGATMNRRLVPAATRTTPVVAVESGRSRRFTDNRGIDAGDRYRWSISGQSFGNETPGLF